MQKLKDVANIKFCLSTNSKTNIVSNEVKTIMPINLLEDNIIKEIATSDKFTSNEETMVQKDDILIKRISPSFVNYIFEIEEEVYATQNLIIIRANNIDAKYLAYLLNMNIGKMIDAYSGASIPAIGRKDIEDFPIPEITQSEQKAIGALWFLSLEAKKLKNKLTELEKIKTEYLLNRFMKTNGGQKNGK